MAADWWDLVTRFVLPPVLGGAGGLISVYANWGIEKQRHKLQARRDLVADWRKNLIPLLNENPAATLGGPVARYAFMEHASYASLRPHLRPGLIAALEGNIVRVNAGGLPFPRTEIIEEIGRIEREWKLV